MATTPLARQTSCWHSLGATPEQKAPMPDEQPATENPSQLILSHLATPTGTALVVCDETGVLRALDWEGYEERMHRLLRRHYGMTPLQQGVAAASLSQSLSHALDAYFSGEPAAIDRIHVATNGTSFQRRVWAGLRQIPAGETRSYGQLAAMIGAPPTAVRAVGLANGANPIGVVVPCHRVIGANGALTGYAGGLARKRWLLTHEGAGFADVNTETGGALSALPLFSFLAPQG